MRVLIVDNLTPFAAGANDALAGALQRQLVMAGHAAEVLRLPCQPEPAQRIPSQMLMVRAFELSNVDHVIALAFPASLIRHPSKTLWLSPPSSPREPAPALQQLIRNASRQSAAESRNVFCTSEPGRLQLRDGHGIAAELLRAPILDPQLYAGGAPGDYIYAAAPSATSGSLELLQAMRYADPDVKLIIAGRPDSPAAAQQLHDAVAQLGLQQRVQLDLRPLPEAAHARYVRQAAAVACVGDSAEAGGLALEAANAGKPLITTTAHCASRGLARHRLTGWVVDPDPSALADAINQVFRHPAWSAAYGAQARELLRSSGLDWPDTLEALLR
jgi:hypothetical protein